MNFIACIIIQENFKNFNSDAVEKVGFNHIFTPYIIEFLATIILVPIHLVLYGHAHK